jgi:tRNA(adenine34) deaminase
LLGQFTPARADDEKWMRHALAEAERARQLDEVPVGAVITVDDQLIASAHNLTRTNADPTAHAELLALRMAAQQLGDWRVLNATLYVTLEPCAMCAGAMVLARIQRLVFATFDPKAGMCGSLGCIAQDPRLNHRLEMTAEVLQQEAAELLRDFFRQRR